jgi:hypothetical protein
MSNPWFSGPEPPRPVSEASLVRVFSLLALLAGAPAALSAQSQKFKLVYRPPSGEAIRYRQQFEMWVQVGSQQARQPILVMTIWSTETATVSGDTVTFTGVVDSATASAPQGGAPPEFNRQAQMMRGAREITRVTSNGRELSYQYRGVSVGDVFAVLLGGDRRAEREYKQWRTMPEDSVEQGAGWDDSVRMRVDSVVWSGRAQYRLRRVERRDGQAVGRIEVSATLRPNRRGFAPSRINSQVDVDVETGRLIRADTRQEDSFDLDTGVGVWFRSNWRTERVR